jgi:hypothetical protein
VKTPSAHVFAGLAKGPYARPAWALFGNVRNTTGSGSRQERYADGIAVSLWPSRGLEIHGIEIKVDRQDWKRELADPELQKASHAEGYKAGVADGPKDHKREAEIAQRELVNLQTSIDAFEKASGCRLDSWNGGHMGEAVTMVMQARWARTTATTSTLEHLGAHLDRLRSQNDEALALHTKLLAAVTVLHEKGSHEEAKAD